MVATKNCLILGGCGFLGSNLAEALLREGHYVRSFDLPGRVEEVKGAERANFEYIGGRFDHNAELSKALDDIDVVFHLISTTIPQSSNEDMQFDIYSNLINTVSFLELCVNRKVRRIIFPSSGGTVYGPPVRNPVTEIATPRPICSYGIVKLAIENYLYLFRYLYGLDYIVLRISNPYGPGQKRNNQGVISAFLRAARNSRHIELWGDGNVVRDFIFVNEVSKAFLKAMTYDGVFRVFNIGSGRGASLLEIAQCVEEVVGMKLKHRFMPKRTVDVPAIYLDISLAKQELQWIPEIGIAEGIRLTWEAMRSL